MSKISLKIKRDKKSKDCCSIEGPEYPSLYLSDVPLPLSKKQIGDTMPVVMTLKFTGYREDNSTEKNHISFDFAVQDIDFINTDAGKRKLESDTASRIKKVFGNK